MADLSWAAVLGTLSTAAEDVTAVDMAHRYHRRRHHQHFSAETLASASAPTPKSLMLGGTAR